MVQGMNNSRSMSMDKDSSIMKAVTWFVKRIRVRMWRLLTKFRPSITVKTKQGVFKVLTGTEESIGRSLYCNGEFELDLIVNTTAFLRSIGKCPAKGMGTLVDVGANNGVISIGMLQTGQMERAIAIEPEPRNFAVLEHNVSLNGLKDRFICLPCAVSDVSKKIDFELSSSNFGDHRVRADTTSRDASNAKHGESGRSVISVQSERLDNLLVNQPPAFVDNIALIWIDVQGYDGFVFKGAKNYLKQDLPVMTEIWPYGIGRSGMTREEYCEIAASIWRSYWVWRNEKFVRYPIQMLDVFFDELGADGKYGNVLFAQ